MDPRKPPHMIGDNWPKELLSVPEIVRHAHEMIGQPNLMAEEIIDPRPDLASSQEHPDRTDDPEFPYSTDGSITIPGKMPNTFVVVESDPKSSTGIAPVPLKHSPVIPVAPRREKTLSDYYGVFGPPKRRS